MYLTYMSLGGLRVFAEASFCPGRALSWVTGENGSGKTSVLEGLYALSHARSFRAVQFDSALRGSEAVVYTEWRGVDSSLVRLGCSKLRGGPWRYRIDGATAPRSLDVAMRAPMLCFDPGAHGLVAGPSERRRRLLDWGLFHVEQAASSLWGDWQRALRQRNQALKARDLRALDAYDEVLAERGERLCAFREAFASRCLVEASRMLAWLSDDLADVSISYRRGWSKAHPSLLDALYARRDSDLQGGFTSVGPQRCDIVFRWQGVDARERVSRGQSKVLALALVLSLAQLFSRRFGRWPLLLLDDLCSELDETRASAVLGLLRAQGAQGLITGVTRPAWADDPSDAVFHVERGTITPLL